MTPFTSSRSGSDLIKWLQLAFAIWSLIRIIPLARVPWAIFSQFWGKRKTEYKLYIDQDVRGNVLSEDFISSCSVEERDVGGGICEIICNEDRIMCPSNGFIKENLKVILGARSLGYNFIQEELNVSTILKVHRLAKFEDVLGKVSCIKISIRKDLDSNEIVENWPGSNNLISRFMPLIPSLLTSINGGFPSLIIFILVVMIDIFQSPISDFINRFFKAMKVCLQKFIGIFPQKIRVILYFIFYSLDKKLVSCNFITNKREFIRANSLVLGPNFYLSDLRIKKVNKISDLSDGTEIECTEFKAEGYNIIVDNITEEGNDCHFSVSIFRDKIFGEGKVLIKSGRFTCRSERLKQILTFWRKIIEIKSPPIICNSKSNVKRMHCMDIESLTHYSLETNEDFYLVETFDEEFEVFDHECHSEDPFIYRVPRAEGVCLEILIKKMGKQILKPLIIHNKEFFGSEKLPILFFIIKNRYSPFKFNGIRSSQLKRYCSDFSWILKKIGEDMKIKAVIHKPPTKCALDCLEISNKVKVKFVKFKVSDIDFNEELDPKINEVLDSFKNEKDFDFVGLKKKVKGISSDSSVERVVSEINSLKSYRSQVTRVNNFNDSAKTYLEALKSDFNMRKSTKIKKLKECLEIVNEGGKFLGESIKSMEDSLVKIKEFKIGKEELKDPKILEETEKEIVKQVYLISKSKYKPAESFVYKGISLDNKFSSLYGIDESDMLLLNRRIEKVRLVKLADNKASKMVDDPCIKSYTKTYEKECTNLELIRKSIKKKISNQSDMDKNQAQISSLKEREEGLSRIRIPKKLKVGGTILCNKIIKERFFDEIKIQKFILSGVKDNGFKNSWLKDKSMRGEKSIGRIKELMSELEKLNLVKDTFLNGKKKEQVYKEVEREIKSSEKAREESECLKKVIMENINDLGNKDISKNKEEGGNETNMEMSLLFE
jgi:hypothetical protein